MNLLGKEEDQKTTTTTTTIILKKLKRRNPKCLRRMEDVPASFSAGYGTSQVSALYFIFYSVVKSQTIFWTFFVGVKGVP